ncbi:hypothetical protein MPTK2_2g20840 [Marchantia polymorpha subsp. ruderalis]
MARRCSAGQMRTTTISALRSFARANHRRGNQITDFCADFRSCHVYKVFMSLAIACKSSKFSLGDIVSAAADVRLSHTHSHNHKQIGLPKHLDRSQLLAAQIEEQIETRDSQAFERPPEKLAAMASLEEASASSSPFGTERFLDVSPSCHCFCHLRD